MIVQTTNTKSGSENCSGKLKNRFQIQALDAAQEAFQGGCMTEEWRDVVGYEEYFSVSSEGKVYSNGKCIFLRAHRLVAEAFIPNPENKPFVNHKNANKIDNRVENLEWVTAQENSTHARDMGLLSPLRGESSPTSKLKEADVLYIRENFKARCREFGARALGKKFGVDKTTIMSVVERKTWSHI